MYNERIVIGGEVLITDHLTVIRKKKLVFRGKGVTK
jgi:hypothetical protein